MRHLSGSKSGAEIKVQRSEGSRFAFLMQGPFERALHLEQKRAERSRASFVLLLLDCGNLLTDETGRETLRKVELALSCSTRETDTSGWFKEQCVVGVIFTELGTMTGNSASGILRSKVHAAISRSLSEEQLSRISVSCHVFPDDWQGGSGGAPGPTLCLDFAHSNDPKHWALSAKKLVDIGGSLLALAAFSPVLIGIAILVKLTSKGPILFRQQRVGQNGQLFTFLKFRSMYTENDSAIHQEYVKKLIAGGAAEEAAGGKATYKLTKDPRITPIGSFLRRTSFDELPQFLNVLFGQMSLVGPRPPIPYEVSHYYMWHRRRLQIKPGITGLWQVKGRSRTKFDDMVRMDLEYARTWSIWLDLKIILQTPRAMFFGDGAY